MAHQPAARRQLPARSVAAKLKTPAANITRKRVTSSNAAAPGKKASTAPAAVKSKRRKQPADIPVNKGNTNDFEGHSEGPQIKKTKTNGRSGQAPISRSANTLGQVTRKRKPLADAPADESDDNLGPRPIKKTRTGSAPQRVKINRAPEEPLTILACGAGDGGELGLGPATKDITRPRINTNLDPEEPAKFQVVQLACGGMHTVALTDDNKVVTWGVNDNGALGRNTAWDGVQRNADGSDDEDDAEMNPHESTPAAIPDTSFPAGTKFTQVAAGDNCSFALTEDGLVFGWGSFVDSEGNAAFGYDSDGNLVKIQPTPVQVPGLKNIIQIACGANHAMALEKSGTIWGWGRNGQHQLGRRLDLGRHGEDSLVPLVIRVCHGSATYIASGQYHSFAVDKYDNVWAWGLNSFGEAGDAKSAGGDSAIAVPTKIRALSKKGVHTIAGGAHHSAAVAANGDCLVWGRLDLGQLGIDFSAAQLEDHKIIRHDEYDKPRICLQPTVAPAVGKAAHVACGTDHTICIDQEGFGFVTGFGGSGQLGLGPEVEEVNVFQGLTGKHARSRKLHWAGAGGQFSMLAGPRGEEGSRPVPAPGA